MWIAEVPVHNARVSDNEQVLVRECTDADVSLLEENLPTGVAQVHAAHLATARTGRTTFLAVWDEGCPLGVCVVIWAPSAGHRGPEPQAGPPAPPEIAHLFVGEQCRGRGAGTALISSAEGLISRRGGERCLVGVSVDNVAAARLYERLGYVDTGEKETYEYTWIDEVGLGHPTVETSRILIKALSADPR